MRCVYVCRETPEPLAKTTSHRTLSASSLPQRQIDHACCDMGNLTAASKDIVHPPSALLPIVPLRKSRPSLHIHTEIFGIRKKSILSDSFLTSLVCIDLEGVVQNHLLIYTGASADRADNSATLAAVTLHSDISIKGGFDSRPLPHPTELAAIQLASQDLLMLQTQRNGDPPGLPRGFGLAPWTKLTA